MAQDNTILLLLVEVVEWVCLIINNEQHKELQNHSEGICKYEVAFSYMNLYVCNAY